MPLPVVVYGLHSGKTEVLNEGSNIVKKENRDFLKAVFPEMTDGEIDRMPQEVEKWVTKRREGSPQYYKMVAECYSSKYCILGIREGDKLVFYGGLLNEEETTAPVCILAIPSLVRHYYTWDDRMTLGWDDPNEDFFWPNSRCDDMGIEDGMLGTVKFRTRFEKVSKEEWDKARRPRTK